MKSLVSGSYQTLCRAACGLLMSENLSMACLSRRQDDSAVPGNSLCQADFSYSKQGLGEERLCTSAVFQHSLLSFSSTSFWCEFKRTGNFLCHRVCIVGSIFGQLVNSSVGLPAGLVPRLTGSLTHWEIIIAVHMLTEPCWLNAQLYHLWNYYDFLFLAFRHLTGTSI